MPTLNIPLFRYPLEDPREWYTRILSENTKLETRRDYIIKMLSWINKGDVAHREHLATYRKEGNPNLLIPSPPGYSILDETASMKAGDVPVPRQVVEPSGSKRVSRSKALARALNPEFFDHDRKTLPPWYLIANLLSQLLWAYIFYRFFMGILEDMRLHRAMHSHPHGSTGSEGIEL
ncbi:hypothetical protein F5Y18DRAFT_380955 [Xylariaceae sp. FL1019]|nr:hypothetical protein F5Y18DRAFT_380955 [Xylariaceae sp. FL1019]